MKIRSYAKFALVLGAGLALIACEKTVTQTDAQSELTWARDALARNPAFEVVASDEQAGIITVREKSTGTVRAIKLADLAAVPVADLAAKPAPAQASIPSPEPSPAVVDSTPGTVPTNTATSPTESADVAAAPPSTDKPYTIERTQGQVKVTGPGISIVSTRAATPEAQRVERGQTAAPIICEGQRMLHLDNRNLSVEGDAIIARGGCELYLTNSRIVASGTGVRVNDATVHISNSYIEGAQNSIAIGSEATVVVRDTTFQGLSRRDENAKLLDQGGNKWR